MRHMISTQKRTKIVCTIGPATASPKSISALIQAGMNMARLNFSHGTWDDHSKMLRIIRKEAEKLGEPVAIMQDLQGPKIRVGDISKQGIELRPGMELILTTGPAAKGKIPVTYKNLHKDVKAGQKMLLDDGLMDMRCTKVKGKDVYCVVGTGGLLLPHKGINLPETKVSASSLSEKDIKDVAFGVKERVEYIALSFVRTAKEIVELRKLIKKYGLKTNKDYGLIRIIAKIEKREAVDNIDEILEVVDGIMVARGDLGIEIPAEDVPLVQKELVEKARLASKPVIVATQMLDSMIRNPRPTRAEVSDVANAVIDHTDAVMLSGETASGKYPIDAVNTMARILKRTEKSEFDNLPPSKMTQFDNGQAAVSNLATILALSAKAKGILVASLSGVAARMVSSCRPELPIFVNAGNETVSRQLALTWGAVPFVTPPCKNAEQLIDKSIAQLLKRKAIKKGDDIVVLAGEPLGVSGCINFMEIKKA